MPFKVKSSILTEAIDFALANPEVKRWLQTHDDKEDVTLEGFNVRVGRPNFEKKLIPIRIMVDYRAYSAEDSGFEDIVIDMIWQSGKGYAVVKVWAAEEVP